MSKLTWTQVLYKQQQRKIPEQRWGHKLVRVTDSDILMLGGFGGSNSEGKYLQDMWHYNLNTSQWNQFVTSGQKPQPRSNYTIHYNERSNEALLFGGGSDDKSRFNSICVLDLQTKIWRKISPKQSQPAPWQRTYHSSEFVFPYLIVFGGESVAGLDLNDIWVFNVETEEWKELHFMIQSVQPSSRRFQSSVYLNGYFYIIGGCSGYKYTLLGDIYRVNLQQLFSNGIYQNFKWECMLQDKILQRWGHSSDVFDNKIYICLGRVSSSQDSFDSFIYNPQTNSISKIPIAQQDCPKVRRRHASLVVGNSLLINGGYNGKYLQDFEYIKLQYSFQKLPQRIVYVPTENIERMNLQLKKQQQSVQKDINMKLFFKGKLIDSVQSNKKMLMDNPFFKNMLKYAFKNQLPIQLSHSSEALNLKIINCAIINKKIPLSKNVTLQFLQKLLKSIEYFCVFQMLPVIERLLFELLNSKNCLEIYNISLQYGMIELQYKAAEKYLSSGQTIVQQYTDKVQTSKANLISGDPEQLYSSINSVNKAESRLFLRKMHEYLKFDLLQTKMRESKTNILSIATQRIKNMIMSNRNNVAPTITNGQKHKNKPNYFVRLAQFISSICMKKKVHDQQAQDN